MATTSTTQEATVEYDKARKAVTGKSARAEAQRDKLRDIARQTEAAGCRLRRALAAGDAGRVAEALADLNTAAQAAGTYR